MKREFILMGLFMAVLTASMAISFAADTDSSNRVMTNGGRMIEPSNWDANSQTARADRQDYSHRGDRDSNDRWNGQNRMNWNGGHHNERWGDRDRNEGPMRHRSPYYQRYSNTYPYSYSYGSPYYGTSAYSYPYYTTAYAYPYSTYNAYPLSTYSYNSGYSGTGLGYNSWYY